MSTTLWGQTAIRGTTKISADGITSDSINNSPNTAFEKRIKIEPIDKADSEIEIRFYKLTALSNTRNLKIIKLSNTVWTSFEYEEWNKPSKIKKYTLVPTSDFDSFIVKLLEQNFTRLPNQLDLQGKMKKFTEVNGKQTESKIVVTDGYSYTVEFKIGDHFRIYQFYNPDSYARFYDNVDELKNYQAISVMFEKDLIRK